MAEMMGQSEEEKWSILLSETWMVVETSPLHSFSEPFEWFRCEVNRKKSEFERCSRQLTAARLNIRARINP